MSEISLLDQNFPATTGEINLTQHVLFFNHIKMMTQNFFFIADQIDTQILLFSKVLMRFYRITGYAKNWQAA